VGKDVISSLEITEMLRSWGSGDREKEERVLEVIYDELRRQARRYLRRERPGFSMQTTELIHEAYIKLIRQDVVEWESRTHFFAISASLMRRILIDHARTRHRLKRGGNADPLPLDDAVVAVVGNSIDLVALDEALDRLAELDPQQARVVELRYFSGLSLEETAKVLEVSVSTVRRDWNVARAWLRYELSK